MQVETPVRPPVDEFSRNDSEGGRKVKMAMSPDQGNFVPVGPVSADR